MFLLSQTQTLIVSGLMSKNLKSAACFLNIFIKLPLAVRKT